MGFTKTATATVLIMLFSNAVLAEKTIQIGDQSGYIKDIGIKDSDLLHVCDLDAFRTGFGYTYMAMWNSHVEHRLKESKSEDEKTHYLSHIFNSEPNIKASLSGNPKETGTYSSCKSNSFEQGKIRGFIYELEDIRSFIPTGAD